MTPRPPALARVLMRVLVPRDVRDDLMAELTDRHEALATDRGRRVADRWYWRQVARRAAESVFPGRLRPRADRKHRTTEGSDLMHGLLHDVRLAIRSLRRSPGFTAAALAVLTLGIGGTTAMFSVLNGILLQPLPYTEPDRLAVAWTINQRQGLPDGSSPYNTRDWLERAHTIDDLALVVRPEFTTYTVTEFGRPDRVHVGVVTANFFDVLGVRAIAGRTFRPDDLDRDEHLVVLSEGYWRQHYGGSPDAIGASFEFNGERNVIVGVVPPEVQLPRPTTQIWLLHAPIRGEPGPYARRNDSYVVLARLAPGASVEAAQSELSVIAADLGREYPETNRYLGVRIRPLLAEITGERLPFVLWTLFGAVVIVLLIAATNVAHLTLARGARRYRELAIRAALGASRTRVIRQLVVEALTLGVVATAGGALVAVAALRGIIALAPGDLPRLEEIAVNAPVLAMTVAVTVLVAPLFALMPSMIMSRQNPAESLRHGGRGSSGRHSALRRVLVTAEVAMAVVLLAEAGLLVRSARAAGAVDPGFDARSTIVAQVDLDRATYDERVKAVSFVDALVSGLASTPGVEGAGVIDDFFIRRFPDVEIQVEGQAPRQPDDVTPKLTADGVYPGFFAAAGVSVLDGRDFEPADIPLEGPPRVAVINRSMAETFWPGRSPVGAQFWWADQSRDRPGTTVVGVVPDLHRGGLDEASYPHAFLPAVAHSMDLLVRTALDPIAAADAVRRVIQQIDPNVPVSGVQTAWDHYGDALAGRRLQGWLLTGFSCLAMLLASIGLYALLFDAVSARRREIGIRIALGATPNGVRGLVLQQGVRLVSVGLVIGLAGAFAASHLTSSLLYGVTAGDPVTLVGVALTLIAVGAMATWLPARRATQVHPARSLADD